MTGKIFPLLLGSVAKKKKKEKKDSVNFGV